MMVTQSIGITSSSAAAAPIGETSDPANCSTGSIGAIELGTSTAAATTAAYDGAASVPTMPLRRAPETAACAPEIRSGSRHQQPSGSGQESAQTRAIRGRMHAPAAQASPQQVCRRSRRQRLTRRSLLLVRGSHEPSRPLQQLRRPPACWPLASWTAARPCRGAPTETAPPTTKGPSETARPAPAAAHAAVKHLASPLRCSASACWWCHCRWHMTEAAGPVCPSSEQSSCASSLSLRARETMASRQQAVCEESECMTSVRHACRWIVEHTGDE